jgi:hypothetical protein
MQYVGYGLHDRGTEVRLQRKVHTLVLCLIKHNCVEVCGGVEVQLKQ